MKNFNLFQAVSGMAIVMLITALGLVTGVDAGTSSFVAANVMAPISLNPDSIALSKFMTHLSKLGRNVQGQTPLITPYTLRMEVVLMPGKSTVKFYPKQKDGDSNTECKLDESCLFYPKAYSLGIQKKVTSTQDADHSEDGFLSCQPFFTYPDPNYFKHKTGSGATLCKESEALRALWQSKLSLTTGSYTVFNDFSTQRLLNIPHVGYQTPAMNGGDNPTYPAYGPTIEEQGFHRVNPSFVIDGNNDNCYQLELSSGLKDCIKGDVDDCGRPACNVAVLLIDGYKFNGQYFQGTCPVA